MALLPPPRLERQVCSWVRFIWHAQRPMYLRFYRRALEQLADNGTALANLFSGRPARGIVNRFLREAGPMCDIAPVFAYAATLVAPLRRASEKSGVKAYVQMWAGQAARLGSPCRRMNLRGSSLPMHSAIGQCERR